MSEATPVTNSQHDETATSTSTEPTKVQTAEASAFAVFEADGQGGRPNTPGHLYVFARPNYTGRIPEQQETAHQRLEKFASVLRIAFQKDEPVLFREFFNRLLATAQATFGPTAFRPEAINDLPLFETEIVQVAGGRIKERYTKRLLKAVLAATVLIVLVSAILQFLLNWGLSAGTSKSWTLLFWDSSISVFHTGLLLAASMWGLFFASVTRNIEPTFATLLTPDADLMPPWVRLLFYGMAVLILALVFQLKVVTFHVGESFSTSGISENGATALLVGFLLGVLERALPQEIEKWSRELLPSARRNG